MNTLFAFITFAFVVAVLMVVGHALFEVSPFAHHDERFQSPGERQKSPHLD